MTGPQRLNVWLLFIALALMTFSSLLHAETSTAPRIGIVTMTPGEEYWARFGHNAIIVDDPALPEPISYNYGFFDFEQPGFFTRFMRGDMRYQLVALPLSQDLNTYAYEGRGAQVQWLNLSSDEAISLRDFLAWNALPENAEYRYDYFQDNCSTRVRDALDNALGGELFKQLSGRSHGLTYRAEALRLGAGIPWLFVGMHAGLGPYADRALSIWDESFVPQRFSDALSRATRLNGEPLVLSQSQLLPDRLKLETAVAPSLRTPFAWVGVGFAALLLWLLRQDAGRYSRLIGASVAAGFWLVCGVGGLVLLALWTLTSHQSAWGNENILLLNLLCLGLLPATVTLANNQPRARWVSVLSKVVVSCTALAVFMRFLPFRIQNNGDFIVLLAPAHVALAWIISRNKT